MIEKTDRLVEGLNAQQRDAVLHDHEKNGPLLILAGAGSGKTAVVTRRITRLLMDKVSPSEILALTFTRKAAEEMRERVIGLLRKFMGEPAEEIQDMQICTFHSLCLSVLKENVNGKSNFERLGFKKPPVLLEEQGSFKVLGTLFSGRFKNRSLPNIDEALFAIEKFESFYGSPEALRQSLPPEERDMNIIELWECYRDEKLKSTAIDFSDMISLCIRLLSESQDILEAYRQRYKHILIDEYQDTNIPQYKLSRLLAGKNHNLFIVGDDDQSIYRFRGADVGNILNFKRDYPNSSIIKLEINYRSAVHILALANNIFKSKPHDLRKTLRVNEDNSHPLFVEPEKIRIFRGKDTREEMEYIKQEMGRVMKFHGFNYSDFAILYRVNRQGDDIRHYLENYKIPWGEGGVVLSTLHGAKGLQYPVVFFVGMEERICPSYPRGKVGEQEFRACMDEEQRLFYVGVTRAQYMLYLTSLRKRMWYGREKRFEESRFLKLVPNNILYKRSFKSKLLEILLEEA